MHNNVQKVTTLSSHKHKYSDDGQRRHVEREKVPELGGDPGMSSGAGNRRDQASDQQGKFLERRMTDLEQNTRQQLLTIESLLREVMTTRGKIIDELHELCN